MKTTPLHAQHVALNAKMAEFAGYDMPLYYDLGVLKEHEWVRSSAGLFDVSHMGQVAIKGVGAQDFLQSLTPSSFEKLPINKAKYTVLVNPDGGIIDDLMVTKTCNNEDFFIVINAGCKEKDINWITSCLPIGIEFTYFQDWALMALQGPLAELVMKDVLSLDLSDLQYMGFRHVDDRMAVSRLGYTGEDGFELSVPAADAPALWDTLLADDRVKPIGLAARDSLRLEMGYCLYGHDIDATTSPLEADLAWVMAKDRIADFAPPHRKRVGIVLLDKGIAREGADILNKEGIKIGVLSSGGFSPSLKYAIGQGYVPSEYAAEGTDVSVVVRGTPLPARVAKMPFVQPRTKK